MTYDLVRNTYRERETTVAWEYLANTTVLLYQLNQEANTENKYIFFIKKNTYISNSKHHII